MSTQEVKRKLTAILSADVKGYSRLMGEDEEWTVHTLNTYKDMMRGLIQQHRGRVVDAPGDSVLAEFASVVDAVQCSVEIQQVLRAKNAMLPENRRMEFRIGINLGDVIEEGEQIYGDGVNIAARLEGLADAGGICISESAYQQIENKLPLRYEYLGEHQVKNIAKPVRAYRAQIEPEGAPEKKVKPRQWQRVIMGLMVAVIAVVAAVVIWKLYIPSAPKQEVTSKEKVTVPQPEKPSAGAPTSPAPSVEPAIKEKVTRPLPEKITKPAPAPAPKMEVASKEKMAYPLPDKLSIAVLPFVNLSDDPKQAFLGDALAEEVINGLAKLRHVFVIARNSSFTYKGKTVDVKQIGREQGVRYVLEGSVQRSGDRLRITAQLIDATTGHHLFSERYDRDQKDIFAIQDDITMKILTEMRVILAEGEAARVMAKGTKNLEAYLKVMQATQLRIAFTNKESMARSRQLAEEAIALDPGYALAYSSAAVALANEVFLGAYKNPKEALERARKLAEKGVALDDSLAYPHSALSWLLIMNRDYDKGVAEAERAVALEPGSGFAHVQLGSNLSFAGRYEEAIPVLKNALRLMPIPPTVCLSHLGTCYRMLGRYEESIVVLKQLIGLEPDASSGHRGLVATYMLAGKEAEARAEALEVLRINPNFSLERFEKSSLFKNQADLDREVDAMRKAGLK